jgi:hypothetical protein
MAAQGGAFTGQLKIDAGFGLQPEKQFDATRAVNWYLVQDPNGKNEKSRLRRFRGKKLRATVAAVPGHRASYVVSNATTNLAYFVAGNKFCQMDVSETITVLGTLTTSTGHVRIVANQKEPLQQLLVVDGVAGWIWDGATFTQIMDANFPGHPDDADYLDGRFLVVNGETNQWFISDTDDGLTWNNFNDARITSRSGDTLVGLAVLHRRIYLLGHLSGESWYNEGRATFPFRRDNNMSLDYGLGAVGSLATGFGCLFFLARTDAGVGAIMMATGAIPEQVSNAAFEYQLHQYTNPSDAVGYVTRTDDGHVQYVLNFTTDNHTWVYDVETQRLFEREQLSGDRDLGQTHFYFNEKHYLGAYNSGKIYEEDDAFLDNDGEAIHYTWISPPLTDAENRQLRVDLLELDCNRGIGGHVAPYDEPMAYLSVSRDGGVTFGNKVAKPLTKAGNFIGRTRWFSIGTCRGSRNLVFKIEMVCKNDVGIFGVMTKGFVGSQ